MARVKHRLLFGSFGLLALLEAIAMGALPWIS